jgi:AbrB family looped-hinge helix DNA binding protein
MASVETTDLVLRDRRQITLPADVCARLGLHTGDSLELQMLDDGVILKPKKALASHALREIQAAFAASGITEEELQEGGRKIREEIYKQRYDAKTTRLP